MSKPPKFPKYDDYPWEDRRTHNTKYLVQLTSQSTCGPIIAETGSGSSSRAAHEAAFRLLRRKNDAVIAKCKSNGTHKH